MIKIENLKKYYRLGDSEVRAVDGVDLTVSKGEFLGIVGASGSGKSTLLNLIGGLCTPTGGRITVEDGELTEMSSRRLAKYRAKQIGMVFQSFNLIPHRTALSNVELALYFNGAPALKRKSSAQDILIKLGMGDRLKHKPDDLSGGEQQRIAIARALVKNPPILLVDEPTGNLDRENSISVAEIFAQWNRQGGTIIMVTHNLELAEKYTHRIMKMDFGRIV
ncbi:ABC transporter ATP-binding protein [bacterium]|nr:ABC transporter ATP-binding protein [bacterium]